MLVVSVLEVRGEGFGPGRERVAPEVLDDAVRRTSGRPERLHVAELTGLDGAVELKLLENPDGEIRAADRVTFIDEMVDAHSRGILQEFDDRASEIGREGRDPDVVADGADGLVRLGLANNFVNPGGATGPVDPLGTNDQAAVVQEHMLFGFELLSAIHVGGEPTRVVGHVRFMVPIPAGRRVVAEHLIGRDLDEAQAGCLTSAGHDDRRHDVYIFRNQGKAFDLIDVRLGGAVHDDRVGHARCPSMNTVANARDVANVQLSLRRSQDGNPSASALLSDGGSDQTICTEDNNLQGAPPCGRRSTTGR